MDHNVNDTAVLSRERSSSDSGFLVHYNDWVVRELELDHHLLRWYWEKFLGFPSLGLERDDSDCAEFVRRFTSPGSLFLEFLHNDLPAGLWIIDNIVGPTADLHVYFFDRKLAEKADMTRYVVKLIFMRFALHRMVSVIPTIYFSTIRLAHRIGMREEGVFKDAVMLRGKWTDQTSLAILREEILA